MSVESFIPVEIERFGGVNKLLDPSDVPVGMSPDAQDVDFLPGKLGTRPGARPLIINSGNQGYLEPDVISVRSFIGLDRVEKIVTFRRDGTIAMYAADGTGKDLLAVVGDHVTAGAAGARMTLENADGAGYLGFYGPNGGVERPYWFDLLDHGIQRGIGENGARLFPVAPDGCFHPASLVAQGAGNISAGLHNVIIFFETASGYFTRCVGIPASFVFGGASGGRLVLTGIIGLANAIPSWVKNVRFGMSAVANPDIFFHVPAVMTVPIPFQGVSDITFDFDVDEATLLDGEDVTYLLSRIPISRCSGITSYANRLHYWGVENELTGFKNLSFTGGGYMPSAVYPAGWIADPTGTLGRTGLLEGGAGNGDPFEWNILGLTSDPSNYHQGAIAQLAFADDGTPLISSSGRYQIRFRGYKLTGINVTGQIQIGLSNGLGNGTFIGVKQAVNFATTPTEYVLTIDVPLPYTANTYLVLFGNGLNSSTQIRIRDIRIVPDNQPVLTSRLLVSDDDDPEGVDAITGALDCAVDNGQVIRRVSKRGNFLEIEKEGSMFVTQDDGQSDPAFWEMNQLSATVGTPSPDGSAIAADAAAGPWGGEPVVIASPDAAWLYAGGSILPLTNEILPVWQSINWKLYGDQVWISADKRNKKLYFGLPVNGASKPTQVWILDYLEGWQEEQRKWCPWNVPSPLCGMVMSKGAGSGVPEVLALIGSASGTVFAMDPDYFKDTYWALGTAPQTTLTDVAINSYYDTAFLAVTGSSGRNLFGFLTAFIIGAGSLLSTAFRVNSAGVALQTKTLNATPDDDIQIMMNVAATRIKFRIQTNAVGHWFIVAKFSPWAKPDPWAPVR